MRLNAGETRGTDAMGSGHSSSRSLSQLWQLPLLVFSVFLFGYAAYLFIDPKPGTSIAQKIESAKTFLKQDPPQAAIEQLQVILAGQLVAVVPGAALRLASMSGLM